MQPTTRVRQVILGVLVLILVAASTWWYIKSGAAPARGAVSGPIGAGQAAETTQAPAGSKPKGNDIEAGNRPEDASLGAPASARTLVTVCVAGAVARPGLYSLKPGSRVGDLLKQAGGALGSADLERVNLARRLKDEGMYLIPRVGQAPRPDAAGRQVSNPSNREESSGGSDESTPEDGESGTLVYRSGDARVEDVGEDAPVRVNLNTAGVEELDTLPGIGPGLARRIIENRGRLGPFRRVEDLVRVPGIGPAILGKFRQQAEI